VLIIEKSWTRLRDSLRFVSDYELTITLEIPGKTLLTDSQLAVKH